MATTPYKTELVQDNLEYLQISSPLMKKYFRQAYSSPTVRLVSGLAAGNLLGMIIGIVGSIVQARFVTPADLGYFRGFSIATGYVFFLHLGFMGVLQRFYPYYIGTGEKDRAVAVAEVCQAWMVAVSALASGAFIVLAMVSLVSGNWRAALAWLVQATTIAGFLYGGYLGATYRTGHDFKALAKSTIVSSTVNLFTLPFFLIWPYVTMAVRSGLGSLVSLVYLHIHRPLRLAWRFSWREWLDLIKHGFPLSVAGYGGTTLWTTIETTLVLRFLGTQALGFWSMSFMVLELAIKVPHAIDSIYIPRVTECFGRTGSVDECLLLCKKPLLWGIPGMILMAGAANIILPFIVPILMPKYIGAIPTMCLMMIVLVFVLLELPYCLLIAMGKLAQQNFAVYFGLGCFVLLALGSVRLGMGLIGIVVASLLGRMMKILAIYVFIYHNRQPTKSLLLKGQGGI